MATHPMGQRKSGRTGSPRLSSIFCKNIRGLFKDVAQTIPKARREQPKARFQLALQQPDTC